MQTSSLFEPPRPKASEPRIARLLAALPAAVKRGVDVSFAKSLLDQWQSRRSLSEKQWPWVEKLAVEFEAPVAKPSVLAQHQFPRLAETFLSAAAGLKFPKLRLATEDGKRVVLTVAGARSREPGTINVTDGGRYGEGTFYGRISPGGTATLRDSASADVIATLVAYDADPTAEAKVQGIRTGRCMCCGLELTDPVSVRSGIGPICAEKWGIPRE
jgi:hypothetical protein